MLKVPRTEIDERIGRLQGRLAVDGLDGALLHGVTNLFYCSGTAQQAHLWVPSAGPPVLLVRRVLERARNESPLDQVEALSSLRDLPDRLAGARRIGMELDILPVSLFERYRRVLGDEVEIVDVGPALRELRAVKSPWDVARIRSSAGSADAVLEEVREALVEGMTELELSIVAEAAERRHGFQGMLRWHAAVGFECPWVHVLAGDSAGVASFSDTPFGGRGLTPAAPYGASHRPIGRGEPVCLDFALARDGWIHDMTRTLVIGRLEPELAIGYRVCLEVLRQLEEAARPGTTGDELWRHALGVVEDAGLADQFMGPGADRVRFVGHGVGLELDELPVIAPRQTMPLAAGNVIALEPKLFYPGLGAVGLENTYLIRGDGVEKLTLSPEDVMIVPG